MKFNLKKSTPAKMTVDILKEQLTNIGLICSDTSKDKLQAYIDDVRRQIPHGSTNACFIGLYDVGRKAYVAMSDANWKIYDTAPKDTEQLKYLCGRECFDWLRKNVPNFDGALSLENHTEDRYDTLEAVKNAFVQAAVVTSATLVDPLDPKDMESALTNVLSPITDENDSDYHSDYQELHLIIVKNYNEQANECDAVGFLGVGWELKIKDYRKKSKDAVSGHDTEFWLQSWSGFYQSWDDIETQYAAAMRALGNKN
ncbi:hypothetical protein [Photorhabdus khanii]|nr:hypothetical protein [Photorhabdus khanii]